MKATSLADQATELRLALNGMRAAIAAGMPIDFAGLDDQVAQLLDAARRAPLSEHVQVRCALEKLLQEIDAVGSELRQYHDVETARRAKRAYRSGAAAS